MLKPRGSAGRGPVTLEPLVTAVRARAENSRAYCPLPGLPEVAEVKRDNEAIEIVPAPGATPMMLLDRLRERNVIINRFEIAKPSLHEIFLKVVEDEDE